MLPPLKLTEAECLTFQELAEHHPYPDYRRRALGMLALSKGHPFPLVAEILGVSLPTPYNWLKAWHRHDLMGLLNGHKGGAPAKLTVAACNRKRANQQSAQISTRIKCN